MSIKNCLLLAFFGSLCFLMIFLAGAVVFHALNSQKEMLTPIEPELLSVIEDNQEESVANQKGVSLIFVGDIMLSRGVAEKIVERDNYGYPFLKVSDYLKTADIVFGNLETAIIDGRKIGSGEMLFRSDPKVAQALKKAGFSVLSLANNHTMNFGEDGLLATFTYLQAAGIQYIGAGQNSFEAYKPSFINAGGIKFGFLAYNDSDVVPISYRAAQDKPGTAFMDQQMMISGVQVAKNTVDFVIVSMHAGNEYQEKPNQSQMSFAHQAIDAGADMVIGHHPHIIQQVERYKGKYIFYSLGNFIFDQRAQKTREGAMVKVYFNQMGVTKIEPQAIYIEDLSQPIILQDEKADQVIARLGLKKLP